MKKNLKSLLGDVKNELKAIIGEKLRDIILYGSYARGNYDEESDIDIIALVEEDELKSYREKVIELEIDLTIKYGLMPSILIENKEYFNKNRNSEFLFQNVITDGKIIYAA
ncbi:MAG: nucleotidyltransferase domain-containing protein [Candidatus Aminicenantes bacterium]|nr:nucleotidyltransferase domain-containing protein [Candidatus Aminicenantes bacterium]